jgi:parvulin-like peptidyl-prolyl isomerase
MIKVMRKHAKYFYFLFFIVILSFIFWGIGGVDNKGQSEVLAEVGEYKITSQEFWRLYERNSRFYRDIYKDKFEEMMKQMNLKETILDSMVDEQVLLISARKMGIQVSDKELNDAITQEPMFQTNGVFDKKTYINRLRLSRLTPEAYESLKRQELTIKKLRRLIELAADTSGIDNQIKVSGDEQIAKMIQTQMVNNRKENAVKSFIEGAKKNIKIIVRKDLIS